MSAPLSVGAGALIDVGSLCGLLGVVTDIALTGPPAGVAALPDAAWGAAHTRQMARLAAAAGASLGPGGAPAAAAAAAPSILAARAGLLIGLASGVPTHAETREWRGGGADGGRVAPGSFVVGWAGSMTFPLPPQLLPPPLPSGAQSSPSPPPPLLFDAVLQSLVLPLLPPLEDSLAALAEGVPLPAPLELYLQVGRDDGKGDGRKGEM